MRLPWCPCVCESPPPLPIDLSTWNNLHETWYVYHGTWAHHNGVPHKSLPSVSVSICVSHPSLLGKGSVRCIPPFVARQRLGKHVPAATNTRNNRRIFGRVICCGVCFLSKESPWVCLYIPIPLPGKKAFPRQRRIAGGVFCAVRAVSKGSRRLVPPRPSYFIMSSF
jgi:hypothetical protein